MKVENKKLFINKDELIKIVSHNPDLNYNNNGDDKIIIMIEKYYDKGFSLKQYKWIYEKVKYIFRHDKNYYKFKDISDILMM